MIEANSASSSANEVSISTLVAGRRARMSLVASMPLPSDRRTSMTTTSGVERSATATASRTELDSATTTMSSVPASRALMPLRTTSWSSTSITRSTDERIWGMVAHLRSLRRARRSGPVGPLPGLQRVAGLRRAVGPSTDRTFRTRDPSRRYSGIATAGSLQRDQHPDGGPLAGAALHLQGAAQRDGAAPQVAEAVAGVGGRGVEAAAVVVDLEDRRAAGRRASGGSAPVQRHPAGGGLGVPADVGQGLADDLHQLAGVGAERDRDLLVDLDHGGDPRGGGDVLGQPPQGLVDVPAGEHAGSQPEDVAAQVADDPVELADGALQPVGDLGLDGARGGG